MRPLFLLLCAALAACGSKAPAAATQAADCQGVPALTGRVVDRADLLSPQTEQRLTVELARLEARTRDQIVVVTLPSLGDRPIEAVALSLGRCWGVGQKDLDNGVLLVIAKADRKLRIEVGSGLENLLKDEIAGQIIRETIAPEFKKGRFDEGVEAGVKRIEGLLLADTRRPQRLPRPGEI
jgi:uncharacterized protein